MKINRFFIKILRYCPASIAIRIAFNLFDDFKKSHLLRNLAFCERALFGGGFLQGNVRDPIEANFALFGTSNIEGMAIASYCLRKDDTVFEFGSNVGTETLAFAGLVGQQGKVVAVEADPENASVLKERVEQNKLSQVIIVPKAVSDSDESVEFHRGPRHFLSNITAPSVGRASAHETKIKSITADELYLLYGPPKLLFMDIQGAEHLALRGAKKLIQSARPIMFIEIESRLLWRLNSSAIQIYELLRENNYKVYDTHGWSLSEIKLALLKKEVESDWLALPAERASVDHAALRNALWRARLLPKIRYVSPLWY